MSQQQKSTFSKLVGFFRSSTTQLKSQQSSSLSSRTTVSKRDNDTSQFDGYLSGIPFDIRRIRNKKQAKSVTHNAVKMELLQKCYRQIPATYFEEQEKIDFTLFLRSKRKTFESQQKINDYLDQVELCLFNQVTSRFDQFVAVLRTIQALDLLVKDNLAKITIMKAVSKHIKTQMLNKANVVLNLQQKKKNREAVLEKLLVLQKVLKSKQQIKNDISNNKESCLEIINDIRDNKAKVIDLKCACNYDKWVEQSELVIKRDFTQNFSEFLFKYITMNATYDRLFWEQLALRKDLLIQVQDISNSTVLFDDELEPEHRKLAGVQISPQFEDKIVQVVVNGWANGQLVVAQAKSSLDQHFIQQFQNLLSDIREFSYERLVQAGEGNFDRFNMQSLLQYMSIEFYSRVLEYYSMILKRYLRRLFSVSKKCISELLIISKTATVQQAQRLQNVMQSIFNIQLFVVKSSLQKFIKLVNLKKIGANIDFFRFKSYLSVIEAWQNYFNNQVSILYSQIVVPTQSPIKQRFYILKNKLNSRFITQSKNQLIQLFFNNLHKYVLNVELKKSLEDDVWQVVDIPTSFYEPIGLLLSGQSFEPKRRNQNNTLQSSLFVDRQTSSRNRSIIKNIDSQTKINMNFKLIKNQCIINGKMYKFTETFLLLIEMMEQYVRIHDSFPNISDNVGTALLKLSAFYNSYSFKLIVEAGAVHFQKIKTKNITARHLAISSLCLQFLLQVLEALSKRMKMIAYDQTINNIKTHHNEISKKLRAILQVKITKSLPEVRLGVVPSSGTLSIINSAKALFDILSEFYSGGQYLSHIFDAELFSKYTNYMKGFEIKSLQKAQTMKQQLTFYFGQLQFLSKIVPQYTQKRAEANNIIMQIFESL